MKRFVAGMLLVSLGLAVGLSLLASAEPDGLEHAMEHLGTGEGEALLAAPMPDYEAPGASATWRRVLAGASGTLVVFGLVLLVGAGLRRAGGQGAPQDD